MFAGYLKSLAMNLVFMALYAESYYFHSFSLVADFKYKYSESNVSCEKSNGKVLAY